MNLSKIDWEDVSMRLNKVMDSIGANGNEIASRAGLSTSAVYKVSKRKENVRLDTLLKIAGALNIDTEWLAHGLESRAPDFKELSEWWLNQIDKVRETQAEYKVKSGYMYVPKRTDSIEVAELVIQICKLTDLEFEKVYDAVRNVEKETIKANKNNGNSVQNK